jgi:hypothetical protein
MTVHVRWPGQTSGAIGLALIFLLLFASRQKVNNAIREQGKETISTNHRNAFKLLYLLCGRIVS